MSDPVILGPDGTPALQATEHEEPLPCDDVGYYRAIVAQKYPDLPADKADEAARAMQGRYLLMQAAYREGLRNGRDVRDRWQHGKGMWWPELAPLQPKERTLVMERVKAAVGIES